MFGLVDTHCHIQSIGAGRGERITRELWAKADGLTADKVVANARNTGVTRMLCVGCDLEDSRLAVDFVHQYDGCFASIGIHPHEAQHFAGKADKLAKFKNLLEHKCLICKVRPCKRVVAIGECGFDFYYTHSPKADQVEVLKFQLELAKKYDLPVIFHVREALDDFWPIFDNYEGKIRGVLHSFTDSRVHLAKALERGLYLGVNGIITFVKDQAQLEVYKAIPLQNLVLETDTPFLTPTPYRGSINEPKQARVIAEFVAKLRGESLEQLAMATTQNAQTLFGI